MNPYMQELALKYDIAVIKMALAMPEMSPKRLLEDINKAMIAPKHFEVKKEEPKAKAKTEIQKAVEVVKEKKKKSLDKMQPAERIIAEVADFYGITSEQIKSPRRMKKLIEPRHVCCYLILERLNYSTKQIGRAVGGRDHTTVLYACKKGREYYEKRFGPEGIKGGVDKLKAENEKLKSEIEQLKGNQ